MFLDSDEGKPISKNAYKKLQKEKEQAEKRAATAARIAAEKAEREANQVVSTYNISHSSKLINGRIFPRIDTANFLWINRKLVLVSYMGRVKLMITTYM